MARILVIEDDADMRLWMEHTLISAGHRVILAADGEEGMKSFRARSADLVITDLFMPNQEGLETIRQLQEEFPELAIIAISGEASPMSEELGVRTMLTAARQMGAAAILQKPFMSQELLAIVNTVLEQKVP
jgi:DNA-binding response OmpR family regulator